MLLGALLALIAVMWRFPATPLGRWLRETIVVPLASASRQHLVFVLIIAALFVAGSELIAIAGSYDLAMLAAWDLSLYVDAVIATVIVGVVARGAFVVRVLRARLTRSPAKRPRGRRRRARRSARKQVTDAGEAGHRVRAADVDGDRWDPVLALA